MARTPRGRNLFAIDQSAIEATLTEANEPLLKRRDALMTTFEKMPPSLETTEQIDEAMTLASSVNDLLGEAKQARLSDGRPFSDATKTVRDFFKRIDGPLNAILSALTERATTAANRQRRLAEEREREAVSEGVEHTEEQPEQAEPTPVVRSRSGQPIISVEAEIAAAAGGDQAEIPLEWVVADFDRASVDLESLRPFLTDSAIKNACSKHLAEHGPNKLTGVTYEERAVTG